MIEEIGNTVLDKDNDLCCLDTKVVMNPSVVHDVQSIETGGKEQYDIFVQEILVICQKPITDTIRRTHFRYFENNLRKPISKLITRLRH